MPPGSIFVMPVTLHTSTECYIVVIPLMLLSPGWFVHHGNRQANHPTGRRESSKESYCEFILDGHP